MSEPVTPTEAPKPTPPAQATEEGAQPEQKVDPVDWKAEARKWEARAKENAPAVKRLAEIEEANKTEAQKAADRLAAAEKAASDAKAEAARYRIATEFSLSSEDAAALEHIPSEDGMRLVATRLAARDSDRKKQGNVVPNEGAATPTAGNSDERQLLRNLFGE